MYLIDLGVVKGSLIHANYVILILHALAAAIVASGASGNTYWVDLANTGPGTPECGGSSQPLCQGMIWETDQSPVDLTLFSGVIINNPNLEDRQHATYK